MYGDLKIFTLIKFVNCLFSIHVSLLHELLIYSPGLTDWVLYSSRVFETIFLANKFILEQIV